MMADTVYFVIAVLVVSFIALTIVRLMKSARKTIAELRDESHRDRLQDARILRQKYLQERDLRNKSRKINGKERKVQWDGSGQRASRQQYFDNEIIDAFESNSAHPRANSELRAPWGWPEHKANRPLIVRPRSRRSQRIQAFVRKLFARKVAVSKAEYRSRLENSMRHLLEDRYGRVGYQNRMSSVKWEAPRLPRKLIEERKSDQILARKLTPDEETRLKGRQEILRLKFRNKEGKKAG